MRYLFMTQNENLNNIIYTLCNEIELDFSKITEIEIISSNAINDWLGKTEPIAQDNILYLKLLFVQSVVDDLNSEDSSRILLSKNIILHELFHCKEILTTSSFYKDIRKLYFHPPITTTKMLLIDTAFHQWSEYYAYYNSAKSYKKDIDISNALRIANVDIEVLQKDLTGYNIQEIKIIPEFIEDSIDFIHHSIQLIAFYNSTHDIKYKNQIEKYMRNESYQYYYPYLKDLTSYMNDLYKTYPNWISEQNFIELGNKLMSFIKIFNLWFPVDCLSKNFVLKMLH